MAGKKENIGKIFEKEVKESFPVEFYVERYKDDTSGFYGVSNPADFRLYKYPYTFLIELKTHKGKSLPFNKIRENQIKGMLKAAEHKGIFAGFLVNFRELEETYYIAVNLVEEFRRSAERKSIPVEWFREHGYRIQQSKKRIRYRYDLKAWLDLYYISAER